MKNLRCAGTIAGESSQAYKDIVTISMVIFFFWDILNRKFKTLKKKI